MAALRNLEKLSLQELLEHQHEVQQAINVVRHRERAQAVEKMREIANQSGLSFDELFPPHRRAKGAKGKRKGTPRSKPYPAPTAFYRNPDDPTAKEWSGRGKRPTWLVNKLAKGAKLDDFKAGA